MREAPVEIEIYGQASLSDFIKALKDAYKEAGPRFGVIPTPAWKLKEARLRRASKAKKAGDEATSSADGGPLRVVLLRPVKIKSSNPKAHACVDLGQASLVVKGTDISITGVDFVGWGRPGLTWEETHGLVGIRLGGLLAEGLLEFKGSLLEDVPDESHF